MKRFLFLLLFSIFCSFNATAQWDEIDWGWDIDQWQDYYDEYWDDGECIDYGTGFCDEQNLDEVDVCGNCDDPVEEEDPFIDPCLDGTGDDCLCFNIGCGEDPDPDPCEENPDDCYGDGGGGSGNNGDDEEEEEEEDKDPCDDADKNDGRADDPKINKMNNEIRDKSTSKEFGAEQILDTFPPGNSSNYKDTAVRSDNNSASFKPNFTWNATDGYTIGISHGHPGGSAPSPADLVNAYSYLSNAELAAAGQEAMDYFKDNFTITAVTQDATYTVNITDWDRLGELYNDFKADRSGAIEAYKDQGKIYLETNRNISNRNADATTFAALKMYGDAVTLTKREVGSSKSSPLKLSNNGSGFSKTPCP